jgi:putative transposase
MRHEQPTQVMDWVDELRQTIPARHACAALTVPPAWYYRQRPPAAVATGLVRRPTPAHALSETERQQVRSTLNSERFLDQAPRTVYAALLDKGEYLCHWRTMYRILTAYDEVRERRWLRRQNRPAKPQLVARAADEVWSWDITRLPGPGRGHFFFLYEGDSGYVRKCATWANHRCPRHFPAIAASACSGSGATPPENASCPGSALRDQTLIQPFP